MNVALAANGGTATASSSYGPEYPVSATNNGERRGAGWASGGAWMDATANAFPDWVEVAFNGSKTIDEVDVFSLQDAWANPSEPTATQTFTAYGLADFTVQYLDRDGVAGGAGRRDPQQHAGVAITHLRTGDDDQDPGADGARAEYVQPPGGNRSLRAAVATLLDLAGVTRAAAGIRKRQRGQWGRHRVHGVYPSAIASSADSRIAGPWMKGQSSR